MLSFRREGELERLIVQKQTLELQRILPCLLSASTRNLMTCDPKPEEAGHSRRVPEPAARPSRSANKMRSRTLPFLPLAMACRKKGLVACVGDVHIGRPMLATSVQMHGENVSAQLANCCGEACDQVVKGSGLRQVSQRRFGSVLLHLWTSDSSTQRLPDDGTRSLQWD